MFNVITVCAAYHHFPDVGALACGAKLILEALRRNKYPSWNAQNKGSVALAEKLGYHFDKEYKVYEVIAFTIF